jgi:hypothetical protein
MKNNEKQEMSGQVKNGITYPRIMRLGNIIEDLRLKLMTSSL